jgi:trk system potassium uptake protein TrkA
MATRVGKDSNLSLMMVKDISAKYDAFRFRIVAVARGINTIIPDGEFKILPQDYVFILARNEDLSQLMKLAGMSTDRRHRVMIVGGGLIGTRVAELLEGTLPVRMIERDERRAEELSFALKRTETLVGDGSDADTLIQAGLLDMDTIITATGDNETNIMTSVLAKHLIRNHTGDGNGEGGKKVLAANEILKYIRRGKLLSMAELHGCDAEVVEIVADAGSPLTGKPLYEVGPLLDDGLIGAVFHDGEWEVAVGSTVIEPGDKVIGICIPGHLYTLERLLSR